MERNKTLQEVAIRSREKKDWRPDSWCRRRRWWSQRWPEEIDKEVREGATAKLRFIMERNIRDLEDERR